MSVLYMLRDPLDGLYVIYSPDRRVMDWATPDDIAHATALTITAWNSVISGSRYLTRRCNEPQDTRLVFVAVTTGERVYNRSELCMLLGVNPGDTLTVNQG